MTCRTLSRTRPSHIVRNISTASEYGIAYSNSVRIGPRLRLFSVIVALESAMRTLAFSNCAARVYEPRGPSRAWARCKLSATGRESHRNCFQVDDLQAKMLELALEAVPWARNIGSLRKFECETH